MSSFTARVLETISRYSMAGPNSRVGVAVSGGADSVCLLHVLHGIAPHWNLRLQVLHVDHGLRGAASAADADFVRDLAAAYDLPFHLRSVHLAHAPGNLEQAGRDARYGFYRERLAAGELDCVATGHTRSDQAETVLFRVLRGTGTAGLAGILPVTRDSIIRPLLYVSRSEVRGWLLQQGFVWREDASNNDSAFTRNRLRQHLLPLLRRDYNPGVDNVLADLAELAREEEAEWDRRGLLPQTPRPGSAAVPFFTLDLSRFSTAAARRAVRHAVAAVKGNLRGIEFRHVEAVLDLARSQQGTGSVHLPGVDVRRSFSSLRLTPASAPLPAPAEFSIPVSPPASVMLPDGRCLHLLLPPERPDQPHDHDRVEDELDWERVAPCPLTLRNWRPGDRYQPRGESHAQKIKFLFQKSRIPVWERTGWPVLVCSGPAGEWIAWSRRFGASVYAAPGAGSRQSLLLSEEMPIL